MNSIISKILNIFIIIMVILLALNQYCVITFEDKLKLILSFLAISLILLSSAFQVGASKKGFIKFLNGISIILILVGGVLTVYNSEPSLIIYAGLVFSACYGLFDLLYKKA